MRLRPEIGSLNDSQILYISFSFICVVRYECVDTFKQQELLNKPQWNTGNTVVEDKRIAVWYLKESA